MACGLARRSPGPGSLPLGLQPRGVAARGIELPVQVPSDGVLVGEGALLLRTPWPLGVAARLSPHVRY